MSISLEIIIATYNRPAMLEKTLSSMSRATIPADLKLRILVADNNSSTVNQAANRQAIAQFPQLDIEYLFEPRQGKSWALNHAITATSAAYIGFIDDDEQLDPQWFEVAARYMRANNTDFVGGPYKPDWSSPPPDWLPAHVKKYPACVGWIEQSETAQAFDAFGGGLCGGNFIVRRSALIEAGCFSTQVGRFANNLMCGEDDELHRQLRSLGKTGMYDPALIIYHHIPSKRMTKGYHIRWAFWSGVSNGVRLEWLPKEPVHYLAGIPRYRFSLAAKGILAWLGSLAATSVAKKAEGFAGLLDICYLVGMLYGKHVFKAPSATTQ